MQPHDRSPQAPHSPPPATQAFWRDAAMPFVESRRACQSRACYRPHHHPTFSIGAVDAGCSLFSSAPDDARVLVPGTLIFVPQTRVHACNPATGTAWSYQMLHLDARWLERVRSEYAQLARGRHSSCAIQTRTADASPQALGQPKPGDITHEPTEPIRILNDPALYARFCQLNALLFSDADRLDKEAALIEFIGDCDVWHGLGIQAPDTSPQLAARIQPALDWLHTACTTAIPLDALAQRVAMSRYQLIRAFRAVTGMTPHAWQLNQRINLARLWIRRGDSLADVAQQLGFADQAHFQRLFKAHTGVTPGSFRA